MKQIRIGSGAGFAGDRITPAVELIEKGNLDYIIFECLAERTMGLAHRAMLKDPKKGFDRLLEKRMRAILEPLKRNGVKMVSNMGAANPEAACAEIARIANELGVTGLKLAAVTGDSVIESIDRYAELDVLEFPKKLRDVTGVVSANAYMGAEGITEALQNGADIVITGRVSDPSLTVGILKHEFGFDATDRERLGQSILAGHLLECAGQVTGGYYADPGKKEVPDLHRLGFPIVEFREDGRFTVSKVPGTGGLVSEATCKEQMIYEIHDPTCYYTPDGVANFSRVAFHALGKDLVQAEGATASPPTDTLKVSVCYKDGYIGEGEISYGGRTALARAKLAADVVQKRLAILGAAPEETRVDYIGCTSLFGEEISARIGEGTPAEVRLRMSVRSCGSETAETLADEIEALYTNGPAGGGGVVTRVSEVLAVLSVFIPRGDARAHVSYREV
ncbi:DUF1446 domain-containing protein [Oscillospiraceae bacterium OttesenSCG-928-G22]|nr:DUF1446 domain-containing protein [Oscillospiraceae bacterium OttesenSCG-928-G22]